MQRMRDRLGLTLLMLAAVAGCRSTAEHGKTYTPPAPKQVEAFGIKSPDLVLLVTGGTNGTLELCNCSGPMPGGLARRAGLLRSYRASFPATFTVDLGDATWVDPNDLRNEYVLRGYQRVGYDAVVLGDQEWAIHADRLDRLLTDANQTYLSTTVRHGPDVPKLPVVDEIRREYPSVKLAVLTQLQREWLLFMPEGRIDQLRFTGTEALARRAADLKADGYTVVVACHGDDIQADETARVVQPDLLLRGNTVRTRKKIRRAHGVPIAKIGGGERVGAIALDVDTHGRIKRLEFRVVPVTEHWPMDYRLIQLYQSFVHVALRDEIDSQRKEPLRYVSPEQCGVCHEPEYDAWKRSPHGQAVYSVRRAERGDDPDCLMCHTTGQGREGGFISMAETPSLAGVTCQACHRFNLDEHRRNDYRAPKVSEASCSLCHTPITSPGFRAEVQMKRIHCLQAHRQGRSGERDPNARPVTTRQPDSQSQ